ncbi:hypothetical protein Dsin_030770 [Dipteronia sinensis]|uniref:Uncharacterized protein n=1 Tax=Dipteronia sinensis TaxID=43782 RepID=A0AAE0DRP0_9ROSI|nr:hypothetical protein Dsin_030770 [Dipteronia sinensis]
MKFHFVQSICIFHLIHIIIDLHCFCLFIYITLHRILSVLTKMIFIQLHSIIELSRNEIFTMLITDRKKTGDRCKGRDEDIIIKGERKVVGVLRDRNENLKISWKIDK